MNPNDKIRQQILQYFYQRNSSATSRMGKQGSAIKISDCKKELKERFGLKQTEVMSNLTYLIDNGWVKIIPVEKTIRVGKGTVPQTTNYYEITAKGIDKIEGGSQFEPKDRYAGINVTATGSSVITLGDGNVVRAKFQDLRSAFDELKDAVTSSTLTEPEKLELAVDVESMKDQLAKEQPNKKIIKELWAGFEKLGGVSGVADIYNKVAPYIAGLLS